MHAQVATPNQSSHLSAELPSRMGTNMRIHNGIKMAHNRKLTVLVVNFKAQSNKTSIQLTNSRQYFIFYNETALKLR